MIISNIVTKLCQAPVTAAAEQIVHPASDPTDRTATRPAARAPPCRSQCGRPARPTLPGTSELQWPSGPGWQNCQTPGMPAILGHTRGRTGRKEMKGEKRREDGARGGEKEETGQQQTRIGCDEGGGGGEVKRVHESLLVSGHLLDDCGTHICPRNILTRWSKLAELVASTSDLDMYQHFCHAAIKSVRWLLCFVLLRTSDSFLVCNELQSVCIKSLLGSTSASSSCAWREARVALSGRALDLPGGKEGNCWFRGGRLRLQLHAEPRPSGAMAEEVKTRGGNSTRMMETTRGRDALKTLAGVAAAMGEERSVEVAVEGLLAVSDAGKSTRGVTRVRDEQRGSRSWTCRSSPTPPSRSRRSSSSSRPPPAPWHPPNW